jgi:site-specific DNA-cytosine methylase
MDRADEPLEMAMIENSPGILRTRKGTAPAFRKIQTRWRRKTSKYGFMDLQPILVDGQFVGHPLSRERVVCASVPKRFKDLVDHCGGAGLPFHIPLDESAKPPPLYEFLDFDTKALKPKDVKGKKTRKYLLKWRAAFRKLCAKGKCDFDLVATDMERDPGGTFTMSLYRDKIPSPQTHNVKILVQGRKTARSKVPKGGRMLKLSERALCMGVDAETFAMMVSSGMGPRDICRGLGNTILTGVVRVTLGAGLEYLKEVKQKLHDHTWAHVPRSLPDVSSQEAAP